MTRVSRASWLALLLKLQLVWVLAGALFLSAYAADDPNPVATAEERRVAALVLQQFPEISFAFTKAPGTGHFASTVLAMKRVRELGYLGPFHLYIHPEVRSAVAKLLPGYVSTGAEEQTISALNSTTHTLDLDADFPARGPGPRKIQRLGIVGGDDHGLYPDAIGVDALLVVQPPGWFRGPELRIYRKGAPIYPHKKSFHALDRVPFLYDAPNPQDPAAFAKYELLAVPSLANKAEGMATLLSALGHHDVMTLYGLSYASGPAKLATISEAVLKWMSQKAKVTTPGGTIVPLISQLNEKEWELFQLLVDGKGLQSQIQVVNLVDPHLPSVLKNLAPGTLVIVEVGSVTQNLWNYLMARSSLPPLVAGVNGVNYLSMLGKPFLTSMRGSSESLSPQLQSLLDDMSDRLMMDYAERIANFFTKVSDPLSRESTIFRTNHQQNLILGDKVTRLLAESGPTICPYLFPRRSFLGSSRAISDRGQKGTLSHLVSWWLEPIQVVRGELISRWKSLIRSMTDLPGSIR